MRFLIITAAVAVLFFAGCATPKVRMVGDTKTYKDGNCEVTVFQTKAAAEEFGIQKEICVVDGSSVFSFDHSVEGAVKKSIDEICSCGVNLAYIAAGAHQSELGLQGVANVTLVGFR